VGFIGCGVRSQADSRQRVLELQRSISSEATAPAQVHLQRLRGHLAMPSPLRPRERGTPAVLTLLVLLVVYMCWGGQTTVHCAALTAVFCWCAGSAPPPSPRSPSSGAAPVSAAWMAVSEAKERLSRLESAAKTAAETDHYEVRTRVQSMVAHRTAKCLVCVRVELPKLALGADIAALCAAAGRRRWRACVSQEVRDLRPGVTDAMAGNLAGSHT
jgi:hypothetical protein